MQYFRLEYADDMQIIEVKILFNTGQNRMKISPLNFVHTEVGHLFSSSKMYQYFMLHRKSQRLETGYQLTNSKVTTHAVNIDSVSTII